jgi:hypothetical protein
MGCWLTLKKYNSFGDEVEVHPTKTMTRHINADNENTKGSSFPMCDSILFYQSDVSRRGLNVMINIRDVRLPQARGIRFL